MYVYLCKISCNIYVYDIFDRIRMLMRYNTRVCEKRPADAFQYFHEQLETSNSTRMVRFLSHRFPSSEAIDYYYGVLREGTSHTFSIDESPCVWCYYVVAYLAVNHRESCNLRSLGQINSHETRVMRRHYQLWSSWIINCQVFKQNTRSSSIDDQSKREPIIFVLSRLDGGTMLVEATVTVCITFDKVLRKSNGSLAIDRWANRSSYVVPFHVCSNLLQIKSIIRLCPAEPSVDVHQFRFSRMSETEISCLFVVKEFSETLMKQKFSESSLLFFFFLRFDVNFTAFSSSYWTSFLKLKTQLM